jgi:hypothetical protein
MPSFVLASLGRVRECEQQLTGRFPMRQPSATCLIGCDLHLASHAICCRLEEQEEQRAESWQLCHDAARADCRTARSLHSSRNL